MTPSAGAGAAAQRPTRRAAAHEIFPPAMQSIRVMVSKSVVSSSPAARLAVYGAAAFSVPLMAGAVWLWPSLAMEVVSRTLAWPASTLIWPVALLAMATLVLALPVGAVAFRRRALRTGRPLGASVALAILTLGVTAVLYGAGLVFAMAPVYD